MSHKNIRVFRRFLFRMGNPQNNTRPDGRVTFCETQALEQCPFGSNVYRETLAANEALGLGLISHEDQRSPELNIPTLTQVEEIHDVRLLFETEVCRRIALRSSQSPSAREQVQQTIRPIHQKMTSIEQHLHTALDEEDRLDLADELWDVDGLFHEHLAGLAGWPLFGTAIRIIRDRLRFTSTPQAQIIERAPQIIEEHQLIIDAITTRRFKPAAVEKAVDSHLQSAIQFFENELTCRKNHV